MKRGWTGLYHDDWWLEHMEGELETTLAKDMDVLLKNSEADRATRARLADTRRRIKDADDVVLPEDGRVYESLHDRIMATVAAMPLEGANPGADTRDASEEAAEKPKRTTNDAKLSWALLVIGALSSRWSGSELLWFRSR